MPRITVSTDHDDSTVTHTEWVSPADFESGHFRAQLAERLAWAVDDATDEPASEPEERVEHWTREPARV